MTGIRKHIESWYDPVILEEEILEFWNRNGIFEKLKTKNVDGERWSFIDGPITANNRMGIHHAWGRSLKDAFQRYHAMKGRRLRYQNGFDCQGLWVEVEVEKELGFASKRDIVDYGMARFVERCKTRARKFSDIITVQSKRLGYWMNWDESYYTMSDENNYAIWAFLRKCHDRRLVYRGHDVMPWCPRCGTGISQHEMAEGYHDTTHNSVYVGFPIEGRENEYLAVWTTTPWTLPAHVAIAVHPDKSYVLMSSGNRKYYILESRRRDFSRILRTRRCSDRPEVIGTISGKDMVERRFRYRAPYDDLPAATEAREFHTVIGWNEITDTEGTGLVHIAPGCGADDFDLGIEHGLPTSAPLDESGRFIDAYGHLSGMSAGDATETILADLEARSFLIGTETYTHTYPHCWRCGSELLYRLVDEWFISMDPWRGEIMDVVKQITWIPDYGRELELDWLRNMQDWMISKKRFWGLALPIWTDGNGHFEVIGSRNELRDRAVEGWREFEGHSPHRPWIDGVKLSGPGGSLLTRVEDVGNPWLDAGIVPFSTLEYETNRDYWRDWFPAELVVESFPGQFRNWFYSLLAMSTMLEGAAPFRTLVGHGQVRDEHGEEMHKSKGNAIWFDDAVEKTGADVLRWYFYSAEIRHNLDFSFDATKHIRGNFLNTAWNCHAFLVNYADIAGYTARGPRSPVAFLDRWILSLLGETVARVNEAFESSAIRKAVMEIESFVDSLSNRYIRLSRRRFWRGESEDRDDALWTLFRCTETMCRLMAPLTPMLAERMYLDLGRVDGNAAESVHLTGFPEPVAYPSDPDSIRVMRVVDSIMNASLRARKQSGVRTRQPLPGLTVGLEQALPPEDEDEITGLLSGEINVKRIEYLPASQGPPTTRRLSLDLRKAGPAFGRHTARIVEAFNDIRDSVPSEGLDPVSVTVDGETREIPRDFLAVETMTPDYMAAGNFDSGWIALDTRIDSALELEGAARDIVRHIQILRKTAGFEITDRIDVRYTTQCSKLASAITTHHDYLKDELLATTIEVMGMGDATNHGWQPHTFEVADGELSVAIRRIGA